MNKSLLSRHTILLLLTLSLSLSCGVKTNTPEFHPLPEVPPMLDLSNFEDSPEDSISGSELTKIDAETLACDYLNSIPPENYDLPLEISYFSPIFQFLDGLELVPYTNKKKPAYVKALHRPATLPQLLYSLSDEYAASIGMARKAIDPITFEEFIERVREKHAKGEINLIEKIYAERKYRNGDSQWLAEKRNEAMVSSIENRVPGIFTAQSGDISKSALMADFFNSTGLSPEELAEYYYTLAPLSLRLALFSGNDWESISHDMQDGLKTLFQISNLNDLPIAQSVCRFVIKQRVTAQFIALKGIQGVPRIKNGRLLPLPTENIAVYPTLALPGAFHSPLNAELVAQEAASSKPTLLPRLHDATNASELLSFLKLWTNIQLTRSEQLWAQNAKAPPKEIRLDSTLLKLSLGLQIINTKLISNELIQSENRLNIAHNNSDENLAKLGEVGILSIDSLKSLNNPTQFDSDFFTRAEISSLIDGDNSLSGKMHSLLLGVGFEGYARFKEGSRNENLLKTLREIGKRLKWKELSEIRTE